MQKPFLELRERLLRAGVAPRHVRRYLNELSDHLADLRREEERAGRSPDDAEAAALARLGRVEQLAQAMIDQRRLHSWFARVPWAMFSFTPLVLLTQAYLFACFILWSGWQIFLPGADTPFGRSSAPIYGFENVYFQTGRMIYFTAPILVGWGIGLVAARQRLKAAWPAVGMALVAWMGGTAQIHASKTGVIGGLGNIKLTFFVPPHDQVLAQSVLHIAVIFTLSILPYLIWRSQKPRSVVTQSAP
jgi:hypothetical protein